MPLIELHCAGIPGIDMQCQRETMLFDMFQQQTADSLSALRAGYKQPCKVMLHHTGKGLHPVVFVPDPHISRGAGLP